jgi:hypothetical protein
VGVCPPHQKRCSRVNASPGALNLKFEADEDNLYKAMKTLYIHIMTGLKHFRFFWFQPLLLHFDHGRIEDGDKEKRNDHGDNECTATKQMPEPSEGHAASVITRRDGIQQQSKHQQGERMRRQECAECNSYKRHLPCKHAADT